tara:strand:- start:1856 stop:2404 length:549 start_codon:yes stop_codon:yes gene_type:complete
MNEDERLKKLMRAGLHDPKNDYKLFIKETNWRAKPKKSDYNYQEVIDKLKKQDPTQCEFFRSPWKYNESSIKITNDKEYIQLLESMVEELRDQVNYKDEEWYWYWIPERLKYKLLSEEQKHEIDLLKDENAQLKSKNIHYLKNIARWRKVARHLKEIILTLDYETNNTPHRKMRLNKTVGDT